MKNNMAKEWLNSALTDLKSIEHFIHDEFLTQVVAFHSQQCVEKSFKALLEFQAKRVPKEHSTIRLYSLVRDVFDLQIDDGILIDFDDLYIESRYPGDLGLLPDGKPTLKNAEEFYSMAKKIYERAFQIIDI